MSREKLIINLFRHLSSRRVNRVSDFKCLLTIDCYRRLSGPFAINEGIFN